MPFNERADEHTVVINDNYHKSMYAFHRRNNKREVIVGWFATTTAVGEYINDNSSLINDFYAGECANPVHLVVDTTLMGDKVNVKGFVNHKNLIGDAFHELKVEVDMTDAEATLIYHMINGQKKGEEFLQSTVQSSLPSAAKRVEQSTDRLLGAIDSLQQYVDDVVDNKAPANREVGIAISDALSACGASQLANANTPSVNARYQDLIMVSYLSTLAQSQALVAEKLNQII